MDADLFNRQILTFSLIHNTFDLYQFHSIVFRHFLRIDVATIIKYPFNQEMFELKEQCNGEYVDLLLHERKKIQNVWSKGSN